MNVSAYPFVCVRVHTDAHMCPYTCIFGSVYLYVHCMQLYVCTCVSINIHVYSCVFIHRHVGKCVCMHVNVHAWVPTRVGIYTYVYL